MMASRFICYLFVLFIISCNSFQAAHHSYPKPIDTTDHPIELQEKKTYSVQGVYADNQFDGARLNYFSKKGDRYQVDISPENHPINMSPWYAFKLWSNEEQLIELVLHYENGKHRYAPKISWDGRSWEQLDSNFVSTVDSTDALLTLTVSADTLWVSAQEIVSSTDVHSWCMEKASHGSVEFSVIGKSKMERDLLFLDIIEGESRKKETIVVLSRQHPPEVTGYFAMQSFIDEILKDNALSNAFRKKYRLLVFPLMNPDGVDLGHWRHNAGGIDLNRDWAVYNQPETQTIADFIVKTTKQNKSKVLIGLDFHSTWYDVYYTGSHEQTSNSNVPRFKDLWLVGIEGSIPDYKPHESPSGFSQPITKGWFYKQFNAEGVTYEIGDETPRPFIKTKGEVAARELMSLLIYR